MGTRWALHLSCTIAAMVVRRNKSWDQSARLPASTAALPKLCRPPCFLSSLLSSCWKNNAKHFGILDLSILDSFVVCSLWPSGLRQSCANLLTRYFVGTRRHSNDPFCCPGQKMEFDPSWFAPTMVWTVFMARDPVKERIWSTHLSWLINWT